MKASKSKKFLILFLLVWTLIMVVFLSLDYSKYNTELEGINVKKDQSQIEIITLKEALINHQNRSTVLVSLLWLFAVVFFIIGHKISKKHLFAFSEKENELKNSDEKFRQYFDENLAVMLLVDPITKDILSVNNAAINYYGYDKSNFLKLKIYDLNTIPPKLIDEKMKLALAKKSNHLSFNHVLSNKEIKDVEVYASPFSIGNKTVMSVIVHDVTEQKRTERALIKSKNTLQDTSKLLETIFNAVPDIISVVDSDYNILRYNKAGYDFLNLTSEQTIGKKHYELMGCELSDKICATRLVYKTKKLAKIERFDENLNKWYEARAYPILDKNNDVYRVIEFLQDITERKQFIDKLEKSKERAEESDRLKSSFLANMSHEIRTPMNAILGFTELLKSNDLSKQNREHYLKVIQNSGNHLLEVINDIIDISKIDAKQTQLHETDFDLNFLLLEIYQFFQSLLMEKGNNQVTFVLDSKKLVGTNMILTDRTKLKQIFINLIGNAIKFTEKGSIKVEYELQDDTSILFSVADTGIGMTEEELGFVFDRFRQGDETFNRVFGGTGLGLSISKELVEILGGKIWVESNKNKGSVFYFTIPVQNTNTTNNVLIETVKNETDYKNIEGKTILIVEDDEYSMLILKEFLHPLGAEILTAIDGLEAIQTCINHKEIDLVLMDIQLPKLNGVQASKRIKGISPQLPIIAQTAHALEEDKQDVMSKGFFIDYISKPINNEELLIKVSKCFIN